jgi:Clostripain family
MSAKWALMVYIAGNNSLSGAATADLQEMQKVGSSEDVKVAAFVKQANKAAKHLLVAKGGYEREETLPDNTDSGSPQTVVDFARWAIRNAPAERYALVLWNHGGGWTPDDFDQLYQQVRGGQRDRHESNRLSARKLSRAVFTSTLKSVLAIQDTNERAICSDDVSGHSLDTIEVGRILKVVQQEIGKPLDLLGMDACLMSTLEVAYQVRAFVKAVVGSEELEPGAGWPYHTLLQELTATPNMDGAALGKVVVRTYVDSYRRRPSQWPITQCAVDTAAVEQFTGTVDALVAALRTRLPAGWSEILKAQAQATSFEFEMLDLRAFCRALVAATSDGALKTQAQKLVGALAPGGYVLAEGHLGPKVEGCGGVSLYLPSPTSSSVSQYYKDLSFAKRHRWDEFLADYCRAVRS